MRLERPRVDMPSSPVARKVGHMVLVCLRQPPQPLHCSRLAINDSSRAENARRGVNGRVMGRSGTWRRFLSILYRPSPMILPGLNTLLGSNDYLISRMTL